MARMNLSFHSIKLTLRLVSNQLLKAERKKVLERRLNKFRLRTANLKLNRIFPRIISAPQHKINSTER